ncbi:MAG: Coenzyme F420 hydrogenase subunit beta [Promethearchaeota archaeon]|nr:MAG: Coenzyme F420 hydrogenase subunit beta [Candidatus Lokiarchaeota archaeon]
MIKLTKMKEIQKIQKGWKELKEEIVDSGKCVYCGACGAFCDNVKFDQEKEQPYDDGSCEEQNTCRDGYGLCYNYCPKTGIEQLPLSMLDKWTFGIKNHKILGHYKEITSVRLTESGKQKIGDNNAGPITGLLQAAWEEELIDSAIVNKKDERFRPIPYVAEEPSDLKDSIGYKPNQAPTLSMLGKAINKWNYNIAVVGTPCQIQGLRKVQNHPRFDYEAYDLVSLAIGTFCFGTFHNQALMKIFQENNINPEEIKKIDKDHQNFKLIVSTDSGTTEIPLNRLYDEAIREACFACSDYTASFADISVGSVGSELGWNTVIIRTDKGKKVFDIALEKGYIESKPLLRDEEELILDLTRNKTDIARIEEIITHSPEIKSFYIRNSRIAKAYRPGNFVVLWLPDVDFLPMSVSKVEGNLLEITVQKIGEGTAKLFDMAVGDSIGIRGPYGNTWNYEDAQNILVVGGGMGIAAVTSLIEPLKQNKKDVFVSIGARDKASLIFEERMRQLIPETLCATEDGSAGRKCMVTETLDEIIDHNNVDLILTCGPEVMMKSVLEIAENKNIDLQASLERKMKCGLGLCGSCIVGEHNETTVCKDGPIFTKKQIKTFPQFGTYSK